MSQPAPDPKPDPQPDPQPDPTPDPAPDPPEEKWDEERAKATIARQRKEEKEAKDALKAANAELEALKKEKKEREDAELTEIERAKAEADEAKAKILQMEAELRETRLRNEVTKFCTELKIVDPDVAFAILDKSEVLDTDGKPKDVKKALENLIKEKPYLVATEQSKTGPGPLPKPDGSGAVAEAQKTASGAIGRTIHRNF